ncbi:hypothetical protein HRI_000751700 [Hibiscus trionum]|uniref:Uncharacterized protein n=1 Tax=Hibiscus trionum TaxID=183268 RepID=A0A9W7H4B7_HIBTR|nr:hypothetical protein HRI_000751700 [Hibiscus trionum]
MIMTRWRPVSSIFILGCYFCAYKFIPPLVPSLPHSSFSYYLLFSWIKLLLPAGDSWFRQNGSYRGLKLLNFMALRDIRAMCGERNGYRGVGKSLLGATVDNYLKNRACGMEYESDWTKNRLSSVLTAQVIRSATSLMPWCCKIPIGDGFHEFL